MARTVGAARARNAAIENGRNRWTFRTPDLFAARREIVDRLVRGLRAGAHDHDDALGLGMPDVLEQAVLPARERGEPVHQPLARCRAGA